MIVGALSALVSGYNGILQAESQAPTQSPRAVEFGSAHNDVARVDVTRRSTLRIGNVRLDAPPADAPKPSTLLKFDVVNDSGTPVRDVLIRVAIVEKNRSPVDGLQQHVMAGPFSIRGHAVIETGYTLNYEVLLRNLSLDCQCVARVDVVSARIVTEP